MTKLDNQNRLLIPRNLIKASDTDFSKEVRLYLRDNELFLDNPSEKNYRICCLGRVKLDHKGRFPISNMMQKAIGINDESRFLCCLYEGKVTLRTIFFIPENR